MTVARLMITGAALVGLLVVVGCSKEKKEEAARLQQQVEEMAQPPDTAAADTMAAAPDTTVDAAAVPEEETVPEMTMPPRPAGKGFTVQVASCESQDYARYLVDLYTQRGYEPYVTTITFNDQTYYRVRIGNFPTMAEAAELKAELADRYSVDAWIDRTEQ